MKNREDVAIFWDYENCPAPSNGSGYAIVNNIRSLALDFGAVKSFKAYLDISEQIPRALAMRSELQLSGVSLIDCPHNGRKDVADKMILVDMLAHAIDNPAPSTVLLITGDRDFAYAVSILRLRHYRVILVTLPNAHPSLTVQASICFDWIRDVVDPVEPHKCPSGYRLGLEQSRNSFPRENSFDSNYASSYMSRGGLEEETFASNEPIDITNYLNGRTQLGRTSQSSSSSFLPRPNLERLRQDTSSSVDGSSRGMPSSPIGLRNAPSAFPFNNVPSPSTISRNGDSVSTSGSSAFSSKSTASITTTIINEGRLPSMTNEKSTPIGFRSPKPNLNETLSVLSDIDARLPEDVPFLRAPVTPPAARPASAFSSVPSLPPIADAAIPLPLTSSNPTADSAQISIPAGPVISQLNEPPKLNDSLAPPSNSPPSNTRVVPTIFSVLVQSLQHYRSNGNFRPLRSIVGLQVSKQGTTYQKAGVDRFSRYVALAEKQGIVELGGMEAGAWICLRPDWYNATST